MYTEVSSIREALIIAEGYLFEGLTVEVIPIANGYRVKVTE